MHLRTIAPQPCILLLFFHFDTVVTETNLPTSVHVLIHGCHLFGGMCPEDEFDGYVRVCDSLADPLAEDDGFCSGAADDNRFSLGIPLPSITGLLQTGPLLPEPEAMTVSMTLDGTNFCEAQFSVTLEEEHLLTGLLALGAPLASIGVSALIGIGAIMAFMRNKKQRQVAAVELEESMLPAFELPQRREVRFMWKGKTLLTV